MREASKDEDLKIDRKRIDRRLVLIGCDGYHRFPVLRPDTDGVLKFVVGTGRSGETRLVEDIADVLEQIVSFRRTLTARTVSRPGHQQLSGVTITGRSIVGYWLVPELRQCIANSWLQPLESLPAEPHAAASYGIGRARPDLSLRQENGQAVSQSPTGSRGAGATADHMSGQMTLPIRPATHPVHSMAYQVPLASVQPMPTTQTVQSQDVSIAQVLQSFYVVPNYQREYVWGQAQVEQLLGDITEELGTARASEAPEYFIGSIVVCPGADGTFELIDGQQRMTTIYVALCAIRDHMEANKQAAPGGLASQLAASSTDANGRDQFRYRLELQYEDSRGFLEQVAKGEVAPPGRSGSTRSMDNILGAYKAVRNHLAQEFNSDAELIRRFYGYFTNRVKLIRIETQDVAKALKVFETINDRGVGLDSMDLLKNLLFMRADRGTFDQLKQLWKQLQDVIFQMKEKPLRFLRYFVVSHYDVLELREDQIYEWLTRNEPSCGYGRDPLGFARDLLETARAYSNFIGGCDESGKKQPQLQSLQFLSGRLRMHLIILLAGRHLKPRQFDRLLREVENLFFCFLISREHTRTIDNHLSRWAMELRRVRNDEELDTFIASSVVRQRATLSPRFDEEFARLSADSIAKYRMVYVLAKLTQQIEIDAFGENERTKWLTKFTDGGFEIEHVVPQSPSAEASIEFGGQVTPETVQMLGNLTLVEQSINASLGNRPYSVKREVYRQSQLLLTRALAERPKVGSNTRIDSAVATLPTFEFWTAETVRQRQAFLARLARRVWSMPDGLAMSSSEAGSIVRPASN